MYTKTALLQRTRASFNFLVKELTRIESNLSKASGGNEQLHGDDSVNGLLGHLCGQLSQYITARIKTMELYP